MIYNIEAIDVLLNEDLILQRYYPLISYKKILLEKFKENKILTNYDCLDKGHNILLECLGSVELLNLFNRFLTMYEIEENKLKIVDCLKISKEEKEAYKELFLLPGVKETRANLYYLSGYKCLLDFINCNEEEIIKNMNYTIKKYNLDCKAALPKEVKTHIAVAKTYSLYSYK